MKRLPQNLLLIAAVSFSSSFLSGLQIDTKAAPGLRINKVALFRTIPYELRPGDRLLLQGSGFSKTSNKIYFNGGNPVTGISTDGVAMSITVPKDLAYGQYKVGVFNKLGTSNNPMLPIYIQVAASPVGAPIITSASLNKDQVVVTGENFTSANKILTNFGEHKVPVSSSDGKSLSFSLSNLSMYENIKKYYTGQKMALWIYVQNEHGVAKNAFKLDLTI